MSNPVLNERSFKYSFDNSLESNHVMTVNGTMLKTCLLGVFMALTFAYTWYLQISGFADKVANLTAIGAYGALVMVLIIVFAPKNNFLAITTSLYAMLEGLFLGSLSATVDKFYPGIVSQAAIGTIFTIFGMYFLYSVKALKCTDKFRKVIFISTFAVFGIYLLQFILSFCGMSIPGLFSNSLIGIGFSVAIVAIAALNLIIDFDFITQFAGKADKCYEWYGGFALMVTIVWLYVEILKLLAKIQSRNN